MFGQWMGDNAFKIQENDKKEEFINSIISREVLINTIKAQERKIKQQQELINRMKKILQKENKIFGFCEDTRINLLQVDGSNGNEYYGTGYTIIVKRNED